MKEKLSDKSTRTPETHEEFNDMLKYGEISMIDTNRSLDPDIYKIQGTPTDPSNPHESHNEPSNEKTYPIDYGLHPEDYFSKFHFTSPEITGLRLSKVGFETLVRRLSERQNDFEDILSLDQYITLDLSSYGIKIPFGDDNKLIDGALNNERISADDSDRHPGNIYVTVKELKIPTCTYADLQIMRIQYDKDGVITFITKNVSDGLLRYFLNELPESEIVHSIKNALSLGEPQESDRDKYKKIVAQSNKAKELDAKIKLRLGVDDSLIRYESWNDYNDIALDFTIRPRRSLMDPADRIGWESSFTPNISSILDTTLLPDQLKELIKEIYLEYSKFTDRQQCLRRSEQLQQRMRDMGIESEIVEFNPTEHRKHINPSSPAHYVNAVELNGRIHIIDLTHDQFVTTRIGPVIAPYDEFLKKMLLHRYEIARRNDRLPFED